MLAILHSLGMFIIDLFKSRRRLDAENRFLRHQLLVRKFRLLGTTVPPLPDGHPGPGGRLGNKQDVQNLLQYMADLAAEVKKFADEGKCYDTAMKEVKLPKYESWGNYGIWLPGNVERYCFLYRSGF